MEQYAKVIFENPMPLNENGGVQYMDNIEVVIDDIPCELEFGIRKGYWWFQLADREIKYTNHQLSIMHTYFEKCQLDDSNTFEDFDATAEITPAVIESFLKTIGNDFETLKFSKIVGRFLLKRICQKEI